jgi:hypothetical protein
LFARFQTALFTAIFAACALLGGAASAEQIDVMKGKALIAYLAYAAARDGVRASGLDPK